MSNTHPIKGLRRLGFLLGVIAIASLMLWFGKITGNDWTTMMQWISVAYMGSDGVEKLAARVK